MLTVSKLRKYAKQLEIVNYSLLSKDELIHTISDVEGQQFIVKGKCTRCNGQGYIKHYAHVEEGICFKCNGSGVEWFDREELEYLKQQKKQNKKYEVVYHLDENSENGYVRKLFETENEANEYYYTMIEKYGREQLRPFRRIQEQEARKDRDGHKHILEMYLTEYKEQVKFAKEQLKNIKQYIQTKGAKESILEMKEETEKELKKYNTFVKKIQKELAEL